MSPKGATAKLTVLVPAATKLALEARAKAKKVSVSEVVRQRLSGEPDDDERAFMEALVDVGKRAAELSAKMDATHEAVERDRLEWPAREAETRRRALAGISEAEGAALQKFFSATTVEGGG